jgi:hypothetical protein
MEYHIHNFVGDKFSECGKPGGKVGISTTQSLPVRHRTRPFSTIPHLATPAAPQTAPHRENSKREVKKGPFFRKKGRLISQTPLVKINLPLDAADN